MTDTKHIPDFKDDEDAALEKSPTARTAPYVVALIHKDASQQTPVVVHPHELLLLARVHGGPHKITIDENADLPEGSTERAFEPEDEFARLEQRYGDDPNTKQSVAAMEFRDVDGFVAKLDAIEADGAPTARQAPATGASAPKAKAAAPAPATSKKV